MLRGFRFGSRSAAVGLNGEPPANIYCKKEAASIRFRLYQRSEGKGERGQQHGNDHDVDDGFEDPFSSHGLPSFQRTFASCMSSSIVTQFGPGVKLKRSVLPGRRSLALQLDCLIALELCGVKSERMMDQVKSFRILVLALE